MGHYEDCDEEDEGCDDDHEETHGDQGDHEGFEGYEESPRQDRQQGCWKEERGQHEEEGGGTFRPEDSEPCAGGDLRWEVDASHGGNKKIWVYIKKNKLNNGRTIKPDATLKAVF